MKNKVTMLIRLHNEFVVAENSEVKPGDFMVGFAHGSRGGTGRGWFVSYHDGSPSARLTALTGALKITHSTSPVKTVEMREDSIRKHCGAELNLREIEDMVAEWPLGETYTRAEMMEYGEWVYNNRRRISGKRQSTVFYESGHAKQPVNEWDVRWHDGKLVFESPCHGCSMRDAVNAAPMDGPIKLKVVDDDGNTTEYGITPNQFEAFAQWFRENVK